MVSRPPAHAAPAMVVSSGGDVAWTRPVLRRQL